MAECKEILKERMDHRDQYDSHQQPHLVRETRCCSQAAEQNQFLPCQNQLKEKPEKPPDRTRTEKQQGCYQQQRDPCDASQLHLQQQGILPLGQEQSLLQSGQQDPQSGQRHEVSNQDERRSPPPSSQQQKQQQQKQKQQSDSNYHEKIHVEALTTCYLNNRINKRRKLKANEPPNDALMLKIAQHVKYSEFNLLRLATDVGMAEGRFTQKTVPQSEALMKIVEVLKYWQQSTVGLRVRDVIEKANKWLKEDMVDREVWMRIQPLVDFDLPPLPPLKRTSQYGLVHFIEERLQQIQEYTKQSLRERPFSTAKGKIWTETPNTIPLEKIFTKLSWVKRKRKTCCLKTRKLSDITQLLNAHHLGENGPVRILVKGQGGMGKTTAMKQLALCWANGTVKELADFDILFYIAMKDIKCTQNLETIIIEQHKGLKRNGVLPYEIKAILDGSTKKKVVILMDGYDEYKPTTNSNVDSAITKDCLADCWIILTSRETKNLPRISEYMDAEAEIRGFDNKRVREYTTKYLGSAQNSEQLLLATKKSGLHGSWSYGILCIPIFLHMICVLFVRNISLPKTKTGILNAIAERCFDWDTIRKTGKKQLHDVKEAVVKLGKLALRGLQRDDLQQVFEKNEILEEVGEEAFSLGLLMGTESCALEEEPTQVYCFHHLLLQQFIAAKYVATLSKKQLKELFPDWEEINKHQEVLRLACGLTAKTQSILDFVYETLTQEIMKEELNMKYELDIDDVHHFLKSLCKEVSEVVKMKSLHNKHINYTQEHDTKVFVPSRFYVFVSGNRERIRSEDMRYLVDQSSLSDTMLPAECLIKVKGRSSLDHSLKVIKQIGKYQDIFISDSDISDVHRRREDSSSSSSGSGVSSDSNSDNDTKEENDPNNDHHEVPKLIQDTVQISRNIRSVRLEMCDLLPEVYTHIVKQLKGCDKLEKLFLGRTEGVPLELGNTIATMTSLKRLNMYQCYMTSQVSCELLKGLSNCLCLEEVDLSFNTLTDCVKNLWTGNSGFPSLRWLCLEDTKLNRADLLSIQDAVKGGKIPDLRELELTDNDLDCAEDVMESLIQVCVHRYADRLDRESE